MRGLKRLESIIVSVVTKDAIVADMTKIVLALQFHSQLDGLRSREGKRPRESICESFRRNASFVPKSGTHFFPGGELKNISEGCDLGKACNAQRTHGPWKRQKLWM